MYCLLLLPLFVGILYLVLDLIFSTLCLSSFAIILLGKREVIALLYCHPDALRQYVFCGSVTDPSCKLGNFRRVLFLRNFAPSRNVEITLSFTDIVKSCPSRECLLMLFVIKHLAKSCEFLQYTKVKLTYYCSW